MRLLGRLLKSHGAVGQFDFVSAHGVVVDEDVIGLSHFRIPENLGGGLLDVGPGDGLAEGVEEIEKVLAVEGMALGDQQDLDGSAAALGHAAALRLGLRRQGSEHRGGQHSCGRCGE